MRSLEKNIFIEKIKSFKKIDEPNESKCLLLVLKLLIYRDSMESRRQLSFIKRQQLVMIVFTSVFSHECISTTRRALAMAIFASNKANRIPTQFLKTKTIGFYRHFKDFG